MNRLRAFVAEFLGTFFICYVGISAILCTSSPVNSRVGLLGVALAVGLSWAVAVSIFYGISGAHLNPAITAGMFVTGRIKLVRGLGYVLFQLLGATTAAMLCNVIFPAEAITNKSLGLPMPPIGAPLAAAGHSLVSNLDPLPAWMTENTLLIVEFTLTFLLVTAFFGTVVDQRGQNVKIGALTIGLIVTVNYLIGAPITGASMNPARSFGPALVLMKWDRHWCYWVATILAGILAALIYQYFFLEQDIEIVEDE